MFKSVKYMDSHKSEWRIGLAMPSIQKGRKDYFETDTANMTRLDSE